MSQTASEVKFINHHSTSISHYTNRNRMSAPPKRFYTNTEGHFMSTRTEITFDLDSKVSQTLPFYKF